MKFSKSTSLLLSILTHSTDSASIPTVSTLDDLPYDSNDRLSTHVLAYPSRCSDLVSGTGSLRDGIFHHAFYSLQGEAHRQVFGHFDDEAECMVVCLEKGTPRSVVARPLPHRYWRDGEVDLDGTGEDNNVQQMSLPDFVWSDGCGKVEYGMVNYHTNVRK